MSSSWPWRNDLPTKFLLVDRAEFGPHAQHVMLAGLGATRKICQTGPAGWQEGGPRPPLRSWPVSVKRVEVWPVQLNIAT